MTLTVAELREKIKNAEDSDTIHLALWGSGETDITGVDTVGSEIILHADDSDICTGDAVVTDGDFYEMWAHKNSFARFKQRDLEIAIRPSSISHWTMYEGKTLMLYVEGVREPIRLFGKMAQAVHCSLSSSTLINLSVPSDVPGDEPVLLKVHEEKV